MGEGGWERERVRERERERERLLQWFIASYIK